MVLINLAATLHVHRWWKFLLTDNSDFVNNVNKAKARSKKVGRPPVAKHVKKHVKLGRRQA